jgi:hypothetical protein
MWNQPLIQTGLYLVVIANMLALCEAVPAEPTPVAAPTPSVEIPPSPPSKGETEPSPMQAPAPGAAPREGEAGWQLPPLVPRPDFISRRPFIPWTAWLATIPR